MRNRILKSVTSSKTLLRKLVYIPLGADKGDCPYCVSGVLRREEKVETKHRVKEGYVCPECGAIFVEKSYRNFHRIAVDSGLYRNSFNKRKK